MPVPETAPSGGFLEVLDTNPGIPLGQVVEDGHQREWCFVKAGVAIEQGEALMFNAAVVSVTDISVLAAVDSTIIEEAGATFITSGVLADMLISVSDGDGEGQLAWVRDVISETKLRVEWLTSDDGKLDTALAVTSDAVIFAPWLMKLATVDKVVNGFAQKDALINKFFWMLCTGIGLGRCDTSATLTANAPLCVGDTAGQLTIVVATAINPLAAIAVHDNDADGTLIPIIACGQPPRGVPKKDRYGYAPALT